MPRHQSVSVEHLSGPPGSTPLYLLDVANDFEQRMLAKWLLRELGPNAEILRIASSKRGKGGDDTALAAKLASPDDLYLIPLRVIWMAPTKKGRRSVSMADIFRPGDPRDPRGLRARWIQAMRPKRIRLIAATGAYTSELLADYSTSGHVDPVDSFVTRRAWRVLDQAERKLRGNRYKIPRFVPEAILSRREFLDAVDAVAAETSLESAAARSKAERYLREIAATHSPYVIDMIAAVIHKLYSMGYGEIKYSEDQVKRIAELGNSNPVIFLPSHRSNLDRLSLQYMLWENDLPPNHTAGGINLNFFPVGPLLRRTGVFFIRRSFRDNELYKTVLRSYLDYLIEKRFPLEWYMEGGRSRSGKLLPPQLGMLHYVVDSLRRGKAEDIQLIPVSIAYDQIQDVPDYAREAQGRTKEKESIGWLVKAVRSLRRRYGDIYIEFGEPISVASFIGSITSDEEESIGLQKTAFEVMYRIGRATPVTPTALMSIALLAARGSARSAGELGEDCHHLAEFVRARGITMTENDIDYSDEPVALAILEGLADNGYVSSHEAVGRRVFWLSDEEMVKISYYRNMVVHYFVRRAFSEMALTSMIDGDHNIYTFRETLLGFRDLFKFEFFFNEKDQFIDDAGTDVAIDVPHWEQALAEIGPSGVLGKMGKPVAFWAVLPFLDAYQVVGDELEALDRTFGEKAFLKACLARAKMYRIEGRLISGESASQGLFESALSLASNRGLLEDSPDLKARRSAFATEVRTARDLAAQGLEAH